jgi:hypothetical protein
MKKNFNRLPLSRKFFSRAIPPHIVSVLSQKSPSIALFRGVLKFFAKLSFKKA